MSFHDSTDLFSVRLLRCFAAVQTFGLTAAGLLGFAATGAAQQSVGPLPPPLLRTRATASAHPDARVDVTMILVPVTVTDQMDRPVMDLTPDSFKVYEDGVPQSIVSLHREDGPISIGFIFDASNSMKNRVDRSVKAMDQFLKTAVPGDEFFLIQFSDHPKVLTGFTPDPDVIRSAMGDIHPEGWTSLQDAIFLGAQRMKSAKNARRALIVLTDGGDNNSRYSEAEVRSLVRESDVRVFSIGLFERPRFMEKLAADTGGRAFWARHLEDLPDTVDHLSTELRNEYVLGYSTQNPNNDGKYRKVRVELLESIRIPLHVFWRRGYYAPGD